MTGFEVCAVALLVGGVLPAAVLSARGRPSNRLVGLQLAAAAATVAFIVLTQVSGFTFELTLPLVLVPLSFAGTLVYTRLLSPRGGTED